MNSDVMHSRVHDDPQGHRPKANHETVGAEGLNFETAMRRPLVEPLILKNLITEVKETVATDVVFSKPRNTSFGALQLWNIRRKSRYAAHSRKQPRIVTGFGY